VLPCLALPLFHALLYYVFTCSSGERLSVNKRCLLAYSIWYSQCVAVEEDGGQPSATIRTMTTIITAGPTVVSTYITYLTPKPTTTTPTVVTITLRPDEPCDHEYLC
jgi:hypothetical protein